MVFVGQEKATEKSPKKSAQQAARQQQLAECWLAHTHRHRPAALHAMSPWPLKFEPAHPSIRDPLQQYVDSPGGRQGTDITHRAHHTTNSQDQASSK
jgi:hypothetical protein